VIYRTASFTKTTLNIVKLFFFNEIC